MRAAVAARATAQRPRLCSFNPPDTCDTCCIPRRRPCAGSVGGAGATGATGTNGRGAGRGVARVAAEEVEDGQLSSDVEAGVFRVAPRAAGPAGVGHRGVLLGVTVVRAARE